MGVWDGMNRRQFPRISYPCLVTIRYNEGEQDVILSHTENVGIGGVCVILKKNVKMFSAVDLEIDLLDTEEHIKCEGKVVWSIRRKSEEKKKPLFYDIGVEFVNLTQADHQRLDRVIKGLLKRNSPVPEQ